MRSFSHVLSSTVAQVHCNAPLIRPPTPTRTTYPRTVTHLFTHSLSTLSRYSLSPRVPLPSTPFPPHFHSLAPPPLHFSTPPLLHPSAPPLQWSKGETESDGVARLTAVKASYTDASPTRSHMALVKLEEEGYVAGVISQVRWRVYCLW